MAPDRSKKHHSSIRRSQRLQESSKQQKQKPQTEDFQFNGLYATEDNTIGQDCELHIYENRYNTRGEKTTLRVDIQSGIEPQRNRSHSAAFVLTRDYNAAKRLENTAFEIRSPHVCKALRDVIKYYPGVNINSTGLITLYNQPRCLFHYRDQLVAYATSSRDSQMERHLNFCLMYIEETLQRELSAWSQLVVNFNILPGLEHRDLWMAFKPGSLLYSRDPGTNSEFVVRLRFLSLKKESNRQPEWHMDCERLECNGRSFGFSAYSTTIDSYDGIKPFITLPAFPLEYHTERQRVCEELLLRGRKFVSMSGIHHRQYKGRAMVFRPNLFPRNQDMHMEHSMEIKDRVILDCESFRNNCGASHGNFLEGSKVFAITSKDQWDIQDEDLLICHHSWPGYALGHKKWAYFSITEIEEVEFNSSAFDSLALESDKKDLIKSLVSLQKTASDYDGLVKGKGKGLTFLLHGPPGVGKTFTAESIADYTRRPLYRLDSGQLTGRSQLAMESMLVNCLSLAFKWEAVVLLDEADVFMQERGLQDLERNGVVSVLLRQLEYYEGILFLTTNRLQTIDSAFRSRIHLSIYYPPLSVEHKQDLWRIGLTRANSSHTPRWLTKKLLYRLAEAESNGREIKNIVRMAHCLAQNGKREMEESDVLRGVRAFELFNTNFAAKGHIEQEDVGGALPGPGNH